MYTYIYSLLIFKLDLTNNNFSALSLVSRFLFFERISPCKLKLLSHAALVDGNSRMSLANFANSR